MICSAMLHNEIIGQYELFHLFSNRNNWFYNANEKDQKSELPFVENWITAEIPFKWRALNKLGS